MVALDNLLNDRLKLCLFGFVHHIGMVLANHRFVGRYLDDIELINLLELRAFGHGRTGHTREFFVKAEVVLEGDGREGFALMLNIDILFCFNRLMQTLVVAAPEHDAPGELIDNQHLAVPHDIVDVTVHDTVGFDRLVDVVLDGHVVGVHEVFKVKVFFGLFHPTLSKRRGAGFFVDDVIALRNIFGVFLRINFFDLGHRQGLHKRVGLAVQVG